MCVCVCVCVCCTLRVFCALTVGEYKSVIFKHLYIYGQYRFLKINILYLSLKKCYRMLSSRVHISSKTRPSLRVLFHVSSRTKLSRWVLRLCIFMHKAFTLSIMSIYLHAQSFYSEYYVYVSSRTKLSLWVLCPCIFTHKAFTVNIMSMYLHAQSFHYEF